MPKETTEPKKYYYKVYFYVGLESEKRKGWPVHNHCGQGFIAVERDKAYFSGVQNFKHEAERELKKFFKKEKIFITFSHASRIKETVYDSFEGELDLYEPYLKKYQDGML